MYNLPSEPGCILHLSIFCPASQDAFHIHVYSTQLARVHFAYMYNLSSKPGCIFASIHIPPSMPGCISHTCIFCPASQDAFHIHVYSAQQARMHFVHVYSTQQLRVLFAYMYILPSKPGCILHTFNYCLRSQGAFCINVYSTQQLRVHFAFMSILSNKPGCILHTFILCPESKGAFHVHVLPAHSCLPIFFPLNMSLP